MSLSRSCCILLASVTLLTASGCFGGIGVRDAHAPAALFAAWNASAIDNDQVSARTQQTLRQLDLTTLYYRAPNDALTELHKRAVQSPEPDLVFAAAEISYLLGRAAEKRLQSQAIAYYYMCAGYTYQFLFADNKQTATAQAPGLLPLLPVSEEAFDPRFRVACDLYNNALSKCIAAAQRVGRLDPSQEIRVPTADGSHFTLSVKHHGFAWKAEEFGPLLFCNDYRVVGLDNQYRGYGLGVPLIGMRVAAASAAPGHAFYPREVSFPVTAFFRFSCKLADLATMRVGQLELYNPLAIRKIAVEGRTVPLEVDLTTPLAYYLSRSDLNGIEYAALLRPERLQDRSGIYLFEPYQPGKIPVLMVHGLLSSPLTWAPLFNELRADPELAKRYQFWFYLYPTGNPYLLTAADLRDAMRRLRQELDPQQQDGALDNMVLVGHSMGGLVSKLLTQSSGDEFWKLASKKPLDELKLLEENRAELQRVFYFAPQPSVKRVVFLGTPHQGSKLSPSWPAKMLSHFVRAPKKLMTAAMDVVQDNPNVWLTGDRVPNSLDLLTPGAPALQLLAHRVAPTSVQYHSIIGEYRGEGKDSSDGVVSYASAHVPGAASELLVPADHTSVHHHPRAVLEVRRILYEHLKAQAAQGPIQLMGGSQ